MTAYHADSAAMRLMHCILLLFTGLSLLAVRAFLSAHPVLMCGLTALSLGISAVLGFLFIPLYIRSIRCTVTGTQITVRYGIFLRQEQSVRLRHVRYVRIIHGPKNGACGLNFVCLHVCGGNLVMPFLSRRDRSALTDFLRDKGVFHAS